MDYYPPLAILSEVEEALNKHSEDDIDWITFVGSGEPSLHASLGWLIRRVKELTKLPVAVITNGTFLYLKYHRQELAAADAVLPSLDAGNAQLYRKINRPHPDFSFERHVEGLTTFSEHYPGKLWVEVMLVQGMNDSEKELLDIAVSTFQPVRL
jgi:wyosine [tRNA(Phe)-imidazoG37] synthetase (radical SAM superfamily)